MPIYVHRIDYRQQCRDDVTVVLHTLHGQRRVEVALEMVLRVREEDEEPVVNEGDAYVLPAESILHLTGYGEEVLLYHRVEDIECLRLVVGVDMEHLVEVDGMTCYMSAHPRTGTEGISGTDWHYHIVSDTHTMAYNLTSNFCNENGWFFLL